VLAKAFGTLTPSAPPSQFEPLKRKKAPETPELDAQAINDENMEWFNAPVAEAPSTQWGEEAAVRKREALAEQDRVRRQQEMARAVQVRARVKHREHVMYGPRVDRNFSCATLNIGFEDRPRGRLNVRTDIPEETLMVAIAEQYEVGGDMELVIDGLQGARWYDVCEYAQYTLYRVETILRLQPQRILRARFIKVPGHVLVPVIMRYGLREERVTVR
jgi:hypothetical protein